MTTTTKTVTQMITEQHATIRQLFAGVEEASAAERADAFQPLIRLLAVHETAEEEVVYPALKQLGDEASAIAEARKAEEDSAKKSLAELEGMDASSAEFATAFAAFRREVESHASNEEAEVLPLLAGMNASRLEGMAKSFAVAEALAPTHGHRTAPEGAVANMLVGPFVAVVDRVRDAIRDAKR